MFHGSYPGDGVMLAVSAGAALLSGRALVKARARNVVQNAKEANYRDFWILLGVVVATVLAVVHYHHLF